MYSRKAYLCLHSVKVYVYYVCIVHVTDTAVPIVVHREKPVFLMYILLVLTAIFKSYPSYADAALYFSLLPLWQHTFSCEYSFVKHHNSG